MTKWNVSFTIKDKGKELTAQGIKLLLSDLAYDFDSPIQNLKVEKES